MQRRGVHVTVVSTISSQPPMIADELRRQADVFSDLAELFEVRIIGHRLEDPPPDTLDAPSAEAPENAR